jgi:hypothetical protein
MGWPEKIFQVTHGFVQRVANGNTNDGITQTTDPVDPAWQKMSDSWRSSSGYFDGEPAEPAQFMKASSKP